MKSGDLDIDPLFESRKVDHLQLSLSQKNEAVGESGLDRVRLRHEALPNLNFSEIQINQKSLGVERPTPFLISSMTAGHHDAKTVNQTLARAAQAKGWLMGVGSQRKQLTDPEASQEWVQLRKITPNVKLLGNIGLSQLTEVSVDQIRKLIDGLEAEAMIVHTNPLQEALQPEGTPQFKDSLKKLAHLTKSVGVPVVLKETGCGFSQATLDRLQDVGLAAVDLGGYGGTHWGRIEGDRAKSAQDFVRAQAAEVFAHWGVSTLDSMLNALTSQRPYEVWASGGLRTGLDAAKCLAMGACIVGFAKPALQASLGGVESLISWMAQVEFELRVAMFCTGCETLNFLRESKPWTINKS